MCTYGFLYRQNILTYSRHYQLPFSDHCIASKIEEIWKSRVPVEFYSRVLYVLVLMMIKRNIVGVPCVCLHSNDINVCILLYVLIVVAICVL